MQSLHVRERVEIRDLIDQFNKAGFSARRSREKRIGHAACIIPVIFFRLTITRAKTIIRPLARIVFAR